MSDARQVERMSDEELRAVRKSSSLATLYTKLNAQFWDGRLVPTMKRGIFVQDGSTCRAVQVLRYGVRVDWQNAGLVVSNLRCKGCWCYGRFCPPGRFTPARITVASPLGATMERRVLLHEMVHCYLYFEGVREADPHGAHFLAERDRLALLGEAV